ncbi:pyridoxal phosphate-dependent aminotransferase [Sulfuriroseicoccus oceanibius]|uniref:Aminotransferase n=1 Tax=Sulfuriroseicoccus oceanibius TaxID=2707525 RepID=A0A6B3LFN9_9BACT|nr:pyridoxal phosphate-dependent aminotransferase [Sulfuriroseicoccus oceanibius]QQL45873.1 pyridoxal phosphate-dependent aminotransferase [Sulfuriroseicoccus oceanibius]
MDLTAERLANIAPSMTLSVTNRAAEMKAAGEDVCSFGAGEPDTDTPDHIKAACIAALEQGATKYTAAAGLPALREAIANKLMVDNGLEYDVSQISVNCGAKHSLFNAILAVCDPGDEVIIPSPYWTSYPEMVRLAGAVPVIVETDEKNGWKLTAEQFEDNMSIKTKMVILNSPSNPTGAMYSRSELEAIAEVALSEDIVILSDEIYEKLVYGDTEHISIASLSQEVKDLTITVNGFSKAYSMTGWRLGYTAAPEKIAAAIAKAQSHSTSAPTTFAQYGAIAALMGDQAPLNDMREELDMRRKYMLSRLNRIHNVTTIEPKGAFYFLVNIRKIGLKSVNFADKLLSRYKVAVVPGIAFGNDYTVRLSYATSLDVIKEGLDRFEDFCRSY